MKMERVESIEISAIDKQTGFSYRNEYVRKHLADAALDETHPMHDRFEWFLWGKSAGKKC